MPDWLPIALPKCVELTAAHADKSAILWKTWRCALHLTGLGLLQMYEKEVCQDQAEHENDSDAHTNVFRASELSGA
jgi:hypothetical protein